MVILISFLVVLLCFSFGYNLYHATEFRCFQSLVDENNELENENKRLYRKLNNRKKTIENLYDSLTLDSSIVLLEKHLEELKIKLANSEVNRELKGKRINDLIQQCNKIYDENKLLKNKILFQDKTIESWKKYSLENISLIKVIRQKELDIAKIFKQIEGIRNENISLRQNNTKTIKIIKKYLNYAGYKHLDIKFTKEEKAILKNLE